MNPEPLPYTRISAGRPSAGAGPGARDPSDSAWPERLRNGEQDRRRRRVHSNDDAGGARRP